MEDILNQEPVQVVKFNIADSEIAKMQDDYRNMVITDNSSEQAVRNARVQVRTKRTDVEKMRKALKEDILERGRMIDTEAKRLTAMLLDIEEPLDREVKRVEGERERVRIQKEAEEQERIQRRVNDLFENGMKFDGSNYTMGELNISPLSIKTFDDNAFGFFLKVVKEEHQKELDHQALIAKQKQEEEQRLEKQRADQEAERQRLETIRLEQEEKERAVKAEQERIENEKREWEAKKHREEEEKKRAEELERWKAEQQKINARIGELTAAGAQVHDGKNYSITNESPVKIGTDALKSLDDESFSLFVSKLKAEKQNETERIEGIEKEKQAEAEQQRKAEEERQAALLPSREKMAQFAAEIKGLAARAPECRSKKATALLQSACGNMLHIANALITDSKKL